MSETETTLIADAVRQVKKGHESIVDLVRKILAGGKERVAGGKERVEPVLTQRKTEPIRTESPARSHLVNINSVKTLLEYVKKYGDEYTVIFTNHNNGIITATAIPTQARAKGDRDRNEPQ